MNVPALKQTSVTPTLSVATLKDSIYAAAAVDIRAMAERVKASCRFIHKVHLYLFDSIVKSFLNLKRLTITYYSERQIGCQS